MKVAHQTSLFPLAPNLIKLYCTLFFVYQRKGNDDIHSFFQEIITDPLM